MKVGVYISFNPIYLNKFEIDKINININLDARKACFILAVRHL